MDKSTIIARLRECEAEAEGGRRRASVAARLVCSRNGNRRRIGRRCDCGFRSQRRLSLIGRVHLENRLTDILGVRADVCDRKMLRPEILERAERESVLVF